MVGTIIAVLGSLAAVGAVLSALLEYRAQGRQRRAEHFLKMMERSNSDLRFLKICNLLDRGDEDAIRQLPQGERREYLGFIEEVAILMNSKLIPSEIAYYMLSYYPLKAAESSVFMETIDPDSQYWKVFFEFVNQMREFEASPPPVKRFRF